MAVETQLQVLPESTPNPNSTRYAINRKLLEGAGLDFSSKQAAASSPLASELFLLPNVNGVYVGPDFVTVSVTTGGDWAIQPLVIQTIEEHVRSGKPAVTSGTDVAQPKALGSLVETGILRVLETEIQPAVAMDGGYIAFMGYEKGIVKLQLRGACHQCPSSMVTLKAGIENRLKQEFPEIVAVEAV